MKNYTLLVEQFSSLIAESYKNNDKKKTGGLFEGLNKKPNLKKLITIVNNLKSGEVDVNYVNEFIDFNINEAKSLDKKELNKLLSENKSSNDPILNDINYILFEGKNAMNIINYLSAYHNVRSHLVNINTWKEVATKQLETISEGYEELTGEDKVLFESYIKSKPEERTKIFENIQTECLEILSEKIKTSSDKNIKIKLYETKDVIYSMNSKNDVKSLVKLHDLKKDLKECD